MRRHYCVVELPPAVLSAAEGPGGSVVKVRPSDRATRNPTTTPERPPMRDAARAFHPPPRHEPPRITRKTAPSGPVGSWWLPLGSSTYQSPHHSHTFPCISYRFHRFAGSDWTGTVRSSHISSVFARRESNSSPKEYAVCVPARQAYSHCASAGRFPPAHAQYKYASHHDTLTTGCRRSSCGGMRPSNVVGV
jgi:hypothetical protein